MNLHAGKMIFSHETPSYPVGHMTKFVTLPTPRSRPTDVGQNIESVKICLRELFKSIILIWIFILFQNVILFKNQLEQNIFLHCT